MILKNAFVLLAAIFTFHAFADEPTTCKQRMDVYAEAVKEGGGNKEVYDRDPEFQKCGIGAFASGSEEFSSSPAPAPAQAQQTQKTQNQGNGKIQGPADSDDVAQKCKNLEDFSKQQQADSESNPAAAKAVVETQAKMKQEFCGPLKSIASVANKDANGFRPVDVKESVKQSLDKKITCRRAASFTIDYDACLTGIDYYNAVINSEAAMNIVQTVQTQNKNANIQKDVTAKAQSGDLQTAAFDAGIASNNVQKEVQQQKMVAFGAAVAALTAAIYQIPGEEKAQQYCSNDPDCGAAIANKKNSILANQDAKAVLMRAAMEYGAKAVAAGIAMKQYDTAAKTIDQAKKTVTADSTDVMVERCAFNPADPACKAAGQRVAGASLTPGEFSFSGGGNNAFNMNPDSGTFGETGATGTTADNKPVASVNSPFKDEAARARDIINPAPPAHVQAGNRNPGSSSGGVGGGMGGGGGATLGSDLNGTNKDGDKEAQIKANKVSGTYGNATGGGFKAVARGKDDANPFASLFDQKGSQGGVVEDRSIASGDIDGAASGLFQKISKRYGQVTADKRIEANNLE